MDFKLVNEILNESRLIKDTGHLKNYTYRDILDFLFIYFLTLQILRKEPEHSDEVKAYVGRTMTWNGRFDQFKLAGNDFYQFLHFVVGKQRNIELLKDADSRLVNYAKVDWGNLRTYLNDLRFGRHNEAFENRFMLKLESDLLITESNYRSLRRLIRDWKDKDYSQKSLVITRLLQAYRIRMFRAELRHPLEQLAKKFRFEIKGVKNPELKEAKKFTFPESHYMNEIDVWKNPSSRDILVLFKNVNSELRGSVIETGDVFVWNAYEANHALIPFEQLYDTDKAYRGVVDFYLSSSSKSSASEWKPKKIIPGLYTQFYVYPPDGDLSSMKKEAVEKLKTQYPNIARMLKPIKSVNESQGKLAPHDQKEFELMSIGQKPAALVDYQDSIEKRKKFKKLAKAGRIKEFPSQFISDKREDVFVYTLPGEEWRAKEINDIYSEVRKTNEMTPKQHRKMGQLLGYSEKDIQFFMNHNNLKEDTQNPFDLPPDVVKAFVKLGSLQRDKPEAAMLKVQNAIGGGVLSYAVEHVGDLTHRMTHMVPYENIGTEMVADKVTKILRTLRNPYGFEKEHLENVKNNARYRKVPYHEDKKKIDDALAAYAKEHSKLPVYNKAQWLAREAAVALGEQNFDRSETFLGALERMLEKGTFKDEATKFHKDEYGRLRNWSDSLDETSKLEESAKDPINNFEEAWELVEKNCSQILNFYRKNKAVFIRGAGLRSPLIFVSSPREDRKPKDLTPDLHNIAVDYIRKKGFKANRDNSIFVGGQSLIDKSKFLSSTTYGYYGKSYIIFPYDNFDYTWSPKVIDFYNQFGDKSVLFSTFQKKRKEGEDFDDFTKRMFKNSLKNSGYTNKNLDEVFGIDAKGKIAMGHTPEVMIRSEKYIAFNLSQFFDTIKALILNKTTLVKDKISDNTSLKEAKLETKFHGTKILKNPSYIDFVNLIYSSKYQTVRTIMDLKGENIWAWDAENLSHDTAHDYLSKAYPENFGGRYWDSTPARFLIAGTEEVPDQFNFGGDSYTDVQGKKDFEWAKKKPIFQRMMKGAEYFDWDKEGADDLHWFRFNHALRMGEAAGVGKIVKGVNTTADVGPDEIKKQAKKFGFKLDKKNKPPRLTENSDKVNKIVNLIKRDCQPWLIKSKGKLIYRGMNNRKKPFFKSKVRTNRKPTHTPVEVQKYIDQILSKKGFKALRSNSIFVSPSMLYTERYDKNYVIFPIGEFDFTWSPKINDLYVALYDRRKSGTVDNPRYNLSDYTSLDKDDFDILQSYTNKDLVRAINSNNEIMIRCDSYYAIEYDYFIESVLPHLKKEKITEAKLIKDFRFPIWQNPTKSDIKQLLDRFSELRGNVDTDGNVYVWKSFDASHYAGTDMIFKLTGKPRTADLYFSRTGRPEALEWTSSMKMSPFGFYYGISQFDSFESIRPKVFDKLVYRFPELGESKNLNEWKVGFTVSDEPILINPSNNDLETLLKKSKYGAVRFSFDDEDNLWIWNADNLTHLDVMSAGVDIEDVGFSLLKDEKGNYAVWADDDRYEEMYYTIEDDPKFIRMTKGKAYFELDAGGQFWDKQYGTEEIEEIKIFKPSSEDKRLEIDQKEMMNSRFQNFKIESKPKELMTIGKYKVLVDQLTKSRNKSIRMFIVYENKNPIGQITFNPIWTSFHPDVFTIIWSFILPEHRGQKIIEQIYEKMLDIGYVLISDFEQSKPSIKIWENLFDKYFMYFYKSSDLLKKSGQKAQLDRITIKSELPYAYSEDSIRLVASKKKLNLNESIATTINVEEEEKKAKKIAELIKRDCKPYLNKSKGKIVYRGIYNDETFLKGKVKEDRRSIDTPKEIQSSVDEVLSNLGFKALRRNSLFVTGDIFEAESYGDQIYVVFPIGDFDFTWSPKIRDFYRYFIEDGYIEGYIKPDGDVNRLKLSQYIKKLYSDKDFEVAINSGNEIMIRCDNYYAIEYSYFEDYVLDYLFDKNLEESKKEFLSKKGKVKKGKRIAELIQKDCKPWLKESSGNLIYRSTSLDSSSKTPDVFKGKVHKNRRPVDTPGEFHELVNRLFKELSIKANRENSLFVTGDESIDYGHWKNYVIFPIGNFNYSWSPEIRDMYSFFFQSGFIEDYKKEKMSGVQGYEDLININELKDFLSKTYRNNHDLVKGIKSLSEIMVNIDHYYAIEKDFFNEFVKPYLTSLKEGKKPNKPGSQRKEIVGQINNELELDKKAKKIANLIYRYCKPYLNESDGKLIYRGIENHKSNLAFKGKPRTKRVTQETPEEFQILTDNIFKGLGFKALRRNSVFVTGNRTMAYGYGDGIYVVFPIGNFDFTWSPKIKDFFLTFFKMYGSGSGKIDNFLPQEKRIYDNPFYSSLNPGGLLTTRAIKRVMKYVDRDKLKKFLEDSYVSNNLNGAISSKKEIMIKGDYYAIEARFFSKYVKPYLEKLKEGEKLKESRTLDLESDVNKVVNLLKQNCSDAIEAYFNNIRLYRGISRPVSNFRYFDQRNTKDFRVAANTTNYFNLLVSNSPNWKNWPKRNKSMIGSNSYIQSTGYAGGVFGGTFIVFPFDGSKIANTNTTDFWDGFPRLGLDVNSFNLTLEDLSSDLKVKISQYKFSDFKKGIIKLHKKIQNVKIDLMKIDYDYDYIVRDDKFKIDFKNSKNPLEFLYERTDPVKNNMKLFTMRNPKIQKSDESTRPSREWWTEGPAYLVEYTFFKEKIEPLLKQGK